MSTKEYDLIASTVDAATEMKKTMFSAISDFIDYKFFKDLDLDDDDAVAKRLDGVRNMRDKFKWLSIWASMGLEKEDMKLDYDEKTNKWTLTF